MDRWIPTGVWMGIPYQIPNPEPLEECPEVMPYKMWMDGPGKYRWYREDGSPRVYTELDYAWRKVYDAITTWTDMRFFSKEVDDIDYFTSEFLYLVPIAWLKFKTTLEFFLGTLDGTNINPDEFKAGFERNTTHALEQREAANSNKISTTAQNQTRILEGALKQLASTDSTAGSENQAQAVDTGKRTITNEAAVDSHNQDFTQEPYTINTTKDAFGVDTKGRAIQYNQGVQAYSGTLTIDNIGQLGNSYASGFQDSVGKTNTDKQHELSEHSIQKTTTKNTDNIGKRLQNENSENTIGERETTYNQSLNYGEKNQTNNEDEKIGQQVDSGEKTKNLVNKDEGFTEHVKETRINYYDQLAFTRTRMELQKQWMDFSQEFIKLFTGVYGIGRVF